MRIVWKRTGCKCGSTYKSIEPPFARVRSMSSSSMSISILAKRYYVSL